MKHPLALLSTLALALAAGALLVLSQDSNPMEDSESSATPGLDLGFGQGGKEERPAFDPTLDGLDELPSTEPRVTGVRRSEMADAEEGVLGAYGNLALQVWDGQEGVPAPKARVFVLDGLGRGAGGRNPFDTHWSELPELEGHAHRADDEGRVTLPPVEEWALVSAHLPGKFGFARIRREHRELETITLVPDETVLVRVVDPMDRPLVAADVVVLQDIPNRPPQGLQDELAQIDRRIEEAKRWAQEDSERSMRALGWIKSLQDRRAQVEERTREERQRGFRRGGRGAPGQRVERVTERVAGPEVRREARARRRTDEQGMASFRHFQLFRRTAEPWWPAQHVDQFVCALQMPLPAPTEVPFAGIIPGEREITLRGPGTGRLVVRTVDLDGKPYRHPVHVNLRVRGTEDQRGLATRQRKAENLEELEFSHVALGSSFEADCQLDDNDFRWQVPSITGPVEPGQTARYDLVVAPDAGMLSGRILGAAGEPLANARPTFLINSEIGRLEGEDITLDAEGRFHLPYKVDERHRAPYRVTVRHAWEDTMSGAERALEELPTGRVTDLGDLRLLELPCVAHGTVVDDRGEPVRGASIQLQIERPTSAQDPTPRFVEEAFLRTRSEEDGRFELLGDVEPGRLRLLVQARDHETFVSDDLRVGARVDVRLQRIARLIGTVLTPTWLADDEMFVRIMPSFGEGETRQEALRDLLGNGAKTFLFDRVKPGLYAVEIHVRQFPDAVLRLDGIEVTPGLREVHPSLKDIEMRAALHRFVVKAVDGAGSALEPDRPLLAQLTRPDGSSGFVGFPWRNGAVEVVSVSPSLDVLPMANGYRAQPAVLGPGESTLIFRELPPVEVVVGGLRAQLGETPVRIAMVPLETSSLPGELVTWDESSSRMARWYRWGQGSSAELGPDDVARLRVMLDGKYRAMAQLGARGRGRRPTQVWLANVEVRLVPGGAPQRVPVTFDPQAIQKGLAELAQMEAARAERERQRQQERGR